MVGTSFAAPTAAGVADVAVDPYLSVDELISGLMERPCPHLSVQDAADLGMPVWPACEAGRNARSVIAQRRPAVRAVWMPRAPFNALSELAAHPAGTGGVASPSQVDWFAPSRAQVSPPVPVPGSGSGGGAMDSGSLAALALLMWLTLTAGGRR